MGRLEGSGHGLKGVEDRTYGAYGHVCFQAGSDASVSDSWADDDDDGHREDKRGDL